MKRHGMIAGVLLALFWVGLPALAQSPMPTGLLVIETADGERHEFTVELAATDEHRATGLMYRQQMAADAGMIFDYGRDRRATMWMRNTYIPLDMLFIASDGTIRNIKQRTVPFSETVIRSKGKVRAVLELNAGTVFRLGIKPGDTVRHAVFGNLEM